MNTASRDFHFKSAQSSRMTAVFLLVATVLAATAALTVPAWWLYQRDNATEQRMLRQFDSYTALNQSRPKLMQAAETLKARDTRKYFLKGATPALMGADLQDVVKAIIEANNGRVLSSQLLPHRDDNGYRLLNGNIQMTANIQNLRQVLYALESREPYLFVDNLVIRAQVPPGFKPQAGFEPDMFIQFDVSGLAPVVAPAAAPKPAPGETKSGSKS